ncbi:hypothetical protein C8R44DRAFT_792419 [Mycena epipterygia]|nr:hypothetical protein C8R44DRAFT_792419 [Mycena epipterygia]
MPRTELNERLARDLTDAIIFDVPKFVEHIFPDECLPHPVDDMLEALTGMRGSHALFEQRILRRPDGAWTTFPQPEKFAQDPQKSAAQFAGELALFLNRVGDAIRDICRLAGGTVPKKKRRWSSSYAPTASLPLSGSSLSEHPALVLFDSKTEEEGWHTALSVAELLLPDESGFGSSLNRLIHDASDVFFNQDDRRFQINLAISLRGFRLVLFDRCGVIVSEVFDVDKRPDLLVRVLAGLMLSSRPTLGYDTTITTLKDGQRQIKVGQDVYEIVARLSISHDVRGKATVCWRAQRNGVDFVIKDNWNDVGIPLTEAAILEMAKDIPGVTKLITLETVMINRAIDSTAPLRSVIADRSLGIKLHQRMVLTPFARKLSHFTSRKELISVFIDAIEAHSGLVDANIIHCDISSNNIMIADPGSESSPPPSPDVDDPMTDEPESRPLRRGVLIDVDGALLLDNIGYWVGLVGTFVFMSSAILIRGSSTRHKPSDDMESFFWVLIYLCIRYAAPNNTTRADYHAAMDGFQAFYMDPANALDIGRYKKQVLSKKGMLERDIFPRFSVYFEPLKPCVGELRDAFVKNKNKFTYEAMLDILRRTRDTLPSEE